MVECSLSWALFCFMYGTCFSCCFFYGLGSYFSFNFDNCSLSLSTAYEIAKGMSLFLYICYIGRIFFLFYLNYFNNILNFISLPSTDLGNRYIQASTYFLLFLFICSHCIAVAGNDSYSLVSCFIFYFAFSFLFTMTPPGSPHF
jgi:hypothetical protein